MARLLDWVEVTPLRQKVGLVALLVVLWSVAFFVWIAQPMIQEREEVILRLQGLDQQIKKFSRAKHQYLMAQKELAQWKSMAKQQEARLGLDVPMSQVFSEMSNVSQQTIVNVILWKPGESKEESLANFKEQRLRLHVEGGFHQVARFLDQMQDLSKSMGVIALSMHSAQSPQGNPTIQATIEFIGYEGPAHTFVDNSQKPMTPHPTAGRG